MFRISVWVYALFLLLCSVAVAAQQSAAVSANAVVPSVVNFSGVLTGVNSKPLTGTVGVTFYLYQDSQGGAPLWMETQNVQPDKFGHYSVALGSASSQGLPANVFANGEARWLGVQVHGQEEQARVLLMSVPYALKALDAETIGGKPASAFMMVPTSNSKSEPPVLPPGTITGSGTADFVPMFTGATTIGNSKIFQTVGGNVGIATTTPAAKLDVAGAGDVRDTLTLFPKLTHPTLSVHGTAFEVNSKGLVTFVSGQTFPGTGTVTSVGSGAGLTGGPITGSGTLSIKSGGVTNAMLANSSLTVGANSPLTGGGSVSLGGSTSLGLKSCGSNQILEFVSGAWTCVNPATGTVTSVGSGLGLSGGPITGSGTLAINTSVVPQLGAANTFTSNNTINVGNDNPNLSVTNSLGGDGIDISSNTTGLRSTTGSDAVVASGAFDGGYFVGDTGGGSIGTGVWSENDTNASFAFASMSFAAGSTDATIGSEGYSESPVGIGVYGQSVIASKTGGNTDGGSYPIGVWGDSGEQFGFGAFGSADDGWAFVGYNNSPSGFSTTWFENQETGNSSSNVLFTYGSGFGGQCAANVSGDFSCTGNFAVIAPVAGGSKKVAVNAVESPENWFEDAGTAQLSSGEAVVNIESLFAETVNTGVEYHVFLTPNGDCKGLYVAQKSATSFVVRELGGGISSIAFDYRIMAKRKGFENVRLADKTESFSLKNRPIKPAGTPAKHMPTAHEVQEQAREHAKSRSVAHLSAPAVNKKQ